MDIQGIKVPVISIHDLIEVKSLSGREQDLSDVEYLKKILDME